MYQIVAIELGAERLPGRRWTVASGFPRIEDASGTLEAWVRRHHTHVLCHEASQLWLVEDESGPQACYFVELAPANPAELSGAHAYRPPQARTARS